MTFLTLLAALLLGRFRPLPAHWQVDKLLSPLADFLESRFNAGERRHGLIAWLVGVAALLLFSVGVAQLLAGVHPMLGWLWNVAMLYLLMGFQRFSHCYTEIQIALRMDNLPQARQALGEWLGTSAECFSASDVARVAIEQYAQVVHRHIFALIASFLLLPGPSGPILYRTADVLSRAWSADGTQESGDFGAVAQQTFAIIDWLPLRLSAVSLAVVGDFENAIYAWRSRMDQWHASDMGIVLAAVAGALAVRLRVRPQGTGDRADRGLATTGSEADVDCMERALGLFWRALFLWLLLSLLL
ncbi:MAG TPA: CobD/CbiB family protein, partial [Accumulibacter sp.]|nr:CobD/CbiB family protein [Accumulibacter sp.]